MLEYASCGGWGVNNDRLWDLAALDRLCTVAAVHYCRQFIPSWSELGITTGFSFHLHIELKLMQKDPSGSGHEMKLTANRTRSTRTHVTSWHDSACAVKSMDETPN